MKKVSGKRKTEITLCQEPPSLEKGGDTEENLGLSQGQQHSQIWRAGLIPANEKAERDPHI